MRKLRELLVECDGPMLCIDLETTGRNPRSDRIIAVGALLFPGGIFGETPHHRLYDQFDPSPVMSSEEAYNVHGLRHETLEMYESFHAGNQTVLDLHKWLFHYPETGCSPIVIAHSADFDMDFLRESYRRLGFWWPEDKLRVYCTKDAAALRGWKNSLDSQAEWWGLPARGRYHNALDDAVLAAQVAYRQTMVSRELPPAFDHDGGDDDFVSAAVGELVGRTKRLSDLIEEELPAAIKEAEREVGLLIEEREGTHGSFEVNAQICNAIMTIIEDRSPVWDDLSPRERVAIFYIAGKLSRYLAEPHTDSLSDIAGYALLAREAAKERGVK